MFPVLEDPKWQEEIKMRRAVKIADENEWPNWEFGW